MQRYSNNIYIYVQYPWYYKVNGTNLDVNPIFHVYNKVNTLCTDSIAFSCQMRSKRCMAVVLFTPRGCIHQITDH